MSSLDDLTLQEMFDASLKDRELSFKSAPGTTMFLHWLVGMVYVFYFASFILLLREVGWEKGNIFTYVFSMRREFPVSLCHLSVRCWGPEYCGFWETSTTPILTQCRRWFTCPSTDTCDGSFCLWWCSARSCCSCCGCPSGWLNYCCPPSSHTMWCSTGNRHTLQNDRSPNSKLCAGCCFVNLKEPLQPLPL